MVGKGGKHLNSKTRLSVDFTTVCRRMREGRPCPYCYVQTERKNGSQFAKTVIDYEPYDRFVLGLNKRMIKRLNSMGGLRMFSFSDYLPQHRIDVEMLLADCELRGLKVKAITKELEFIRRFHDHPAISVIHLSVDGLPKTAVPLAVAKRYRKRYRKVLVRAAVLSAEALERFGGMPWVDILTLNHGANGFHKFKPKDRRRAASRFPGRVCCVTGKCSSCKVRCGLRADGSLRSKHA